ncbi:uncharacterized protein E0L32_002732 [Thyridium curvatum]|uniref:Tat pathway signal sequence n=1 Tax=Thyridium curvatum TaxID=1093900 RepID=A0A507BFF4_9PEZI|nr:uncharacterized protein E0L32_002732 [Thyridium curvatum]TPX18223.1 hypothetical protein E0L32_002732 [Thyridium curvatum]
MNSSSPTGYRPLQGLSGDDEDEIKASVTRFSWSNNPGRDRWVQLAIIIPWLLLALVVSLSVSGAKEGAITSTCQDAQVVYSPAQSVIEYELRKFTDEFEDYRSVFQGPPTDARDNAWESLYDFGQLVISSEKASSLWNKTSQIGGTKGKYSVELDVFHQLHCLNILRMSRYEQYYREKDSAQARQVLAYLETEHVEHCIESLRQSIMCHSDITPLVSQWNSEKQQMELRSSVVHSCRSFQRVREWASDHQLKFSDLDLDVTGNAGSREPGARRGREMSLGTQAALPTPVGSMGQNLQHRADHDSS